ncbi:MAG TPA: HAD-IA family hydrolase [Thermoleophilaceae bacterium]|nr:HAD-IA family hydrolase [Thermoleophilaceae bacterium]
MPRTRAVVFDLDDTLYPESAYVRSGFRAVAAEAARRYGVAADEAYAELERMFEEGVRGDTFDRWLKSRGIDGDVADLVAAYRAHEPTIEPFPEAPSLLERLRAQGYLLGLLSDGEPEIQYGKLNAIGLRDAFDAMLVSGELGRDAWKPSPRGLLALAERLGVEPSEAVYVSDNPAKDFKAARDAGMRSIRVRREGGVYSHLEPECADYAPDIEAESLAAAAEALGTRD